MIVSGFTRQLKGWWDNYLTTTQQQSIYNSVTKSEGDNEVSNAVYTLTCTIVEHFTGRWTDNSEHIRVLLNG